MMLVAWASAAAAAESVKGADEVQVGREVPVTAMHRTVGPGNNTPQIAAHPEDEEFLALANRLDAPDYSCALHVSGDGGESWTPVEPVTELPQGAEKCYGPEIAFGPDGILYFLFVGLAGEGNRPMGVYLTKSDDGGRSFGEPQQLLGELKFGVRMAMDRDAGQRGRLHFTWIDARSEPATGGFGAPPNPIMAAHSDDGGESLSEPVLVSDPQHQRVVGPALEVGPDGEVHVAYYNLGEDVRDYRGMEGPVWDGTWEMVLASSRDGGQSYSWGDVVDAEVTPHERIMVVFSTPPPALTVGDQGRVCLGWTDARHGDADVLARCSSPDTDEWTGPVRLNDDPRANGVTQTLPQLAVASNGRVDAVFYDRRRAPKDTHNDVFFTYSTDGGRSFADNTRVTRDPSFALIGQQYAIPSARGMVEFGDRLALHSSADRAIAAWADTRNSRPPSRAQDVFAATLTELPGGTTSALAWSAVWLTAGVAGAVALIGVTLRHRHRSSVAPGDHASDGAEPNTPAAS